MQRLRIWIIVMAMGSFLLLATTSAQQGGQAKGRGGTGGGWGPGSPYGQMYNPQTVETVKREIVQVDHITPMRGMSGGTHVLVKTATETLDVHVGPRWYLDHQEAQLALKDQVEVRGSPVTMGGKAVIIAAEVKKGNDALPGTSSP